MAPRKRTKIDEETIATIYTLGPTKREFVSSGCTLLDCALGGGWALGAIANLVGDASTSKTSISTETVANFLTRYPNGAAKYAEAESAFDPNYAEALGMPLDKVEFCPPDKPITTVEDFARDLGSFVGKRLATNTPGIYVLDSLDALSDEAEMSRDIGEGAYGTKKAAKMSELLRTSVNRIEQSRTLLLIVSQVRENIGVMFGEKYKRSGGKALDFFSSQIVWLSKIKTLEKTINKIKRPYGIIVRAKVKKNKVGPPHREAQWPFIFYFGADDLQASVDWLQEVGQLPDKFKGIDCNNLNADDYYALATEAAALVKEIWAEVEDDFRPKRSKYGSIPHAGIAKASETSEDQGSQDS